MFDCAESVDLLLSNITKRLFKGGYFISTIPDANVIVKRLRSTAIENKDGDYVYGN